MKLKIDLIIINSLALINIPLDEKPNKNILIHHVAYITH